MEPSLAGHARGAAHLAEILAAVLFAARAASGSSEPVTSIAAATTAVPPDVSSVASELRARCPAARIALFEDQVVSHAAALGTAGAVATVGTGIGISALSESGTMVRIDGWGPDLGDRGSAWQIGRDGLRAGFAARDGVGPGTTLEKAAAEFCGGIDLGAAVRLLAREDRVAWISSFARTVCALEDEVARAIVEAAVADLLASVGSALSRTGTTTASFRGRLLLSDVYRLLLERGGRELGWNVLAAREDVLDVDHGLLFADPYRACALALHD
ncbi:hypothetical protein ACTXLV_16580 [Brachybacterium alimentarium]|uniref:hypothetical protein n=1 Tax=Brachybacterium alimentarium TaxID=47845 RepID=UPI003FD20EEE